MNYRERFLRTASFSKPDRVFYAEHNPTFPLTLARWHSEGLPQDTYPRTFFGLDRFEVLPIRFDAMPEIEKQIIKETDQHRIVLDGDGILVKEFKNRDSGVQVSYQYLKFPVRTRQDFLRIKKRYNASSPKRVAEFWQTYRRSLVDRDYPLRLNIEGMFWWVRKLMGFEGICTAIYDDPHLIMEMMEFIVDFEIDVLNRTLGNDCEENIVDYVVIFEDMAYKNGPMISPTDAKKFMLPGYRKLIDCLKAFGIDIIIVDSDGNVDSLIPLWLETGINGTLPCEVAAGMDVRELRKKYGKELIIVGGIDKRALSQGRNVIREEVFQKVPHLVEAGGYFPTVDHQVPHEVPLDNYRYYLEVVREATNFA